MPLIAIANRSSFVDDASVRAMVQSIQEQVRRDFAPIWGLDATLTFVGTKQEAPRGAWLVAVLDTADQAGALGYHDVTRDGLPLGKAFAKTTLEDGGVISVTLSHEVLEMLGDPEINLCAQVGQRLYSMEVCDAPESDEFAYRIGANLVSDFVTPAWFRPTTHVKGPFDFRKLIKKPLTLLKGGYLQYLDIGSGAGWQQLTANEKPNARARAHTGSRRERRRVGAHAWERSTRH